MYVFLVEILFHQGIFYLIKYTGAIYIFFNNKYSSAGFLFLSDSEEEPSSEEHWLKEHLIPWTNNPCFAKCFYRFK